MFNHCSKLFPQSLNALSLQDTIHWGRCYGVKDKEGIVYNASIPSKNRFVSPATLLPFQLPDNDLEKAAENDSSIWATVTNVECLEEVPGSWHLVAAWTIPGHYGHVGVNQWVEKRSVPPLISVILTFN